MGKITIDASRARSEIKGIQNQISGSLEGAKSKMSQLGNVLQESEGEFVTAMKEQFQAESEIIGASEVFFAQVCQALLEAVDGYEAQDQKIAAGFEQEVS